MTRAGPFNFILEISMPVCTFAELNTYNSHSGHFEVVHLNANGRSLLLGQPPFSSHTTAEVDNEHFGLYRGISAQHNQMREAVFETICWNVTLKVTTLPQPFLNNLKPFPKEGSVLKQKLQLFCD